MFKNIITVCQYIWLDSWQWRWRDRSLTLFFWQLIIAYIWTYPIMNSSWWTMCFFHITYFQTICYGHLMWYSYWYPIINEIINISGYIPILNFNDGISPQYWLLMIYTTTIINISHYQQITCIISVLIGITYIYLFNYIYTLW